MPDITEEIEVFRKENTTTPMTAVTQEIGEIETTVHIVPETIIIIHINPDAPRNHQITHSSFPENWRKTAQTVARTTRIPGCSSHQIPQMLFNRKQHHTENWTVKQKLNDGYDRSYHPYHSTNPRDNYDQ